MDLATFALLAITIAAAVESAARAICEEHEDGHLRDD